MGRHGTWEDRPWESRAGSRDWERWRREQERGWREDEPWGARGRGEWDEDRAHWGESRREWPAWGEGERRGVEHEERRYSSPGGERWEGSGVGRWARPEGRDRPWVEPGPERRQRGDTRGLVEWEDRGPLAWLREKARMARSKPSRGPKGYSRSDDRIEDEVCERVARSGVESDDIEVKVEHREVTLTGTVRSREEKWWLESLVDDVFGVEEVHNRLRVQRDLGERSAAERSDPSAGKRELPH